MAWSRAWSLQQEILARLLPHAARWPEQDWVALTGVPRFIHGAPVFEGRDLGRALRLRSGREDLFGFVLHPHMTVKNGELIQMGLGKVVFRYPLTTLALYDYSLGRFRNAADLSLRPPPPKPSFLSKLFLGPGMEW